LPRWRPAPALPPALGDGLPMAAGDGALQGVGQVQAWPEARAVDPGESRQRADRLLVLLAVDAGLAQPGGGLGTDVAQLSGTHSAGLLIPAAWPGPGYPGRRGRWLPARPGRRHRSGPAPDCPGRTRRPAA